MNKNKQIIGFADQTFCDKNAPPKILSKRNRKNEMTIPAKRIHQTAMGFQAINGESYICFPENSRSHNMMLFVAEIRKRNLSNKDIIPYIDCAINDYSVKRETSLENLTFNQWAKIYLLKK